MERGILLQRAMNARLIIIGCIPTQDPAQVRLPEYDYVVETFPVVPKIQSGGDSRGEAESAHHPMRCLRSSTCLQPS
jgi:hypothetical protein